MDPAASNRSKRLNRTDLLPEDASQARESSNRSGDIAETEDDLERATETWRESETTRTPKPAVATGARVSTSDQTCESQLRECPEIRRPSWMDAVADQYVDTGWSGKPHPAQS